jgi:transcriptional regulator with XRE-family HTH domain
MKNLQLLRIAAGMNQSQLAVRLGINQSELSLLETGKYELILSQLAESSFSLFGASWSAKELLAEVVPNKPHRRKSNGKA